MNFAVTELRLRLGVEGPYFASGTAAALNRFRGALGAALRQMDCAAECAEPGQCPRANACLYSRFFDPSWRSGPSGYRNAPRPFVLRWRGADDERVLEVLLFEAEPALEIWSSALELAASRVAGARVLSLEREERRMLPLAGSAGGGLLRLRFASPTELKSQAGILEEPRFLPLFERLLERVWALGRLYQQWPPAADPSFLLRAAAEVELLRFDWVRSASTPRRSARSRQIHELRGFTGWAEYRGEIGPLLPLLEIGRFTGVGRQTVWGQGEIRVESYQADAAASEEET